jgi:hypothetical protein
MSRADHIMLYVGAVLIKVWGVAHIIPTESVVSGFGAISEDSKRIITMEWVAEGLILCFIGLLVLYLTIWGDCQNPVCTGVYRKGFMGYKAAFVGTVLLSLVLCYLSAYADARIMSYNIKDLWQGRGCIDRLEKSDKIQREN